ncbi:uncharacterized protein LOC129877024 [Solanum dulcamara]|uniref:uncharacterized protein LOC129877024 n=1 Tax=Solanum dulcamara TaxID=45834 RepID=UPI002486C8C7|nr:uncharacterized protein LOC129877024 [Solanum dulcamara]XP_055808477.1 uncharacterized protein LOC129877024 [Solanum dulcamara]
MWERKQTHTFTIPGKYAPNFRNLPRDQLGGVIFGCTNDTIRECLEQQLVGLPGQHIVYVKNVNPGLPVFLFNYTDKKLHGIFEAASSGQMQINPYAWSPDGSEKTKYPAQVMIRVRLHCEPLPKDKFRPIIANNYYKKNLFWFELDHAQSNKLISRLSSHAYAPSSTPHYPAPRRSIIQGSPANNKIAENRSFVPQDLENKSSSSIDSQAALDEKNFIYMKLKEIALDREWPTLSRNGHPEESTNAGISYNDVSIGQAGFMEPQPPGEEKTEDGDCDLADYPPFIAQLLTEVKELKAFKEQHIQEMSGVEKKLANAQEEIKLLKGRCLMLDSPNPSRTLDSENVVESDDIVYDESIILAGGYDGNKWLPALDLYSPLNDALKSLKPMSSFRSYFAIANLSRELYIFGGKFGRVQYNTVESYNPADDKWTMHPGLNKRNSNLSGATLKDKIFAMGGGNGIECFSEVEMYDPQVGRWIPSRSMWQKRFSLAAAELNGALYAVGGFDGGNYLATAERFDPREHAWTKIESMSTKRASHALVPLGGKLYALGGFDGSQMMPSIEIYDPRRGTWIIGEPMNYSRGFSTAAVLKESIYVIGGAQSDNETVDTIERYNEGQGWETTSLRALGKRCFSSAIVLEEV